MRAAQVDASFPPNPWFFRPAAETRAQLDARSLRNVGYPACGYPDSPTPCRPAQLYGSLLSCGLGLDVPAGDRYAPVIHHDCDSCRGNSGGPIFYYDQQSRPVLVGLHVATDDLDDPLHPNVLKHFSTNTMAWINGLL